MKTKITVNKAFERAISLFDAGSTQEAKEIYEEILLEDHNSFDAHHLHGVCDFKLGNFEDAITSIEKAIELNPNILNFYIHLGESFRAFKQYKKAESTYKKAIDKDKDSAAAYHGLAMSYKEDKQYDKAIIDFKKAIKLNKECYICYYDMAKTYEKLNKSELCFFYLQKVIKLNPNFYEALFSIAQYYRKTKNEKKMHEYLQKTIDKKPKHAGANHLLASLNEEDDSIYSLEYAKELFDRYADFFEEHLVNTLKYKVPFIIREKLKLFNLPRKSKILDLGCGTGLLGKTVVDIFPSLVGVDISSNMIEEARKKDIYSSLHTNDIHDFLLDNKQKFDLIIAPDVFIYIGALEIIFSRVKETLKDDGYFIFTIEPDLEINISGYHLGKSGRFSHTMRYIESLCEKIGFIVIDKEKIILREENKIGQEGVIYTLIKQT